MSENYEFNNVLRSADPPYHELDRDSRRDDDDDDDEEDEEGGDQYYDQDIYIAAAPSTQKNARRVDADNFEEYSQNSADAQTFAVCRTTCLPLTVLLFAVNERYFRMD